MVRPINIIFFCFEQSILKDKVAEDIRNVISLDPVIPIHPKKISASFGQGLSPQIKFEGIRIFRKVSHWF